MFLTCYKYKINNPNINWIENKISESNVKCSHL